MGIALRVGKVFIAALCIFPSPSGAAAAQPGFSHSEETWHLAVPLPAISQTDPALPVIADGIYVPTTTHFHKNVAIVKWGKKYSANTSMKYGNAIYSIQSDLLPADGYYAGTGTMIGDGCREEIKMELLPITATSFRLRSYVPNTFTGCAASGWAWTMDPTLPGVYKLDPNAKPERSQRDNFIDTLEKGIKSLELFSVDLKAWRAELNLHPLPDQNYQQAIQLMDRLIMETDATTAQSRRKILQLSQSSNWVKLGGVLAAELSDFIKKSEAGMSAINESLRQAGYPSSDLKPAYKAKESRVLSLQLSRP